MQVSTHYLAKQYLDLGLCIIPVRHKTKMPAVDWKEFQTERPTTHQIDTWFRNRAVGMGVVCGDVSGGLVCLDFDDRQAYDAFIIQNPRCKDLPTAKSHRGMHVFFRSRDFRHSTELYVDGFEGKAGDLIANKKFVVLPPTLHPEGEQREWIVPIQDPIPTLQRDDLKLGKTPIRREMSAGSYIAGNRHNSLMTLGLKFADLDLPMNQIAGLLREANLTRCQPPLPVDEVEGMIRYLSENRGNFLPFKGGRNDDLSLYKENIITPPSPYSEDHVPERLDKLFLPVTEYMANTNSEDAVDWLIEGMLPLSFLTILGATSKAGKSCFVTKLAHAVASGSDFLGMKTSQGAVLWLACEESETERRMILHRYEPAVEHLYICHDKVILDSTEGIRDLTYWAKRTKAKLIVIDPLYGAVKAESLSDGRSARTALEGLKEICRSQNLTAVVLHHFTKKVDVGMTRERFADSNQLLATASMDWIMDSSELPEGGREIRLVGTGRGEFANKTWLIHSSGPTEYTLVASGTREECNRDHIDHKILRAVEAFPSGCTAEDVAQNIGGAVRSIQNRLTFMLKDCRLTVVGKRGKANIYGFPQGSLVEVGG